MYNLRKKIILGLRCVETNKSTLETSTINSKSMFVLTATLPVYQFLMQVMHSLCENGSAEIIVKPNAFVSSYSANFTAQYLQSISKSRSSRKTKLSQTHLCSICGTLQNSLITTEGEKQQVQKTNVAVLCYPALLDCVLNQANSTLISRVGSFPDMAVHNQMRTFWDVTEPHRTLAKYESNTT